MAKSPLSGRPAVTEDVGDGFEGLVEDVRVGDEVGAEEGADEQEDEGGSVDGVLRRICGSPVGGGQAVV
jgi:hypothetical protein